MLSGNSFQKNECIFSPKFKTNYQIFCQMQTNIKCHNKINKHKEKKNTQSTFFNLGFATISRTSLAIVLLSHCKTRASASFFTVSMRDSKFNCTAAFFYYFCHLTPLLHIFLQKQQHAFHGHLYNLMQDHLPQ